MMNSKTNITAVVIWFNPDKTSIANILTYSSFFKKIYIVDNSLTDNSTLAAECLNSFYIPNRSNMGIAKATNIGCERAFQDGFDWVMTMDQDSSWDITELKKFINLIENNKDGTIASFAPTHSNQIKSVIGDIKNKTKNKTDKEIIFQSKVMASGNIINLNIWKNCGKFNEDLFIDEVDHEFCYKLLKNGYKICEFQDVYMFHTLGNVKKTILPRPCKHSGVRLFYIFRNILFIKRNYPENFKNNGYKKYIMVTFIQKLFELKFSDLKYIFEGIYSFKKNIYGSYENFLSKKRNPTT